MSSQRLSVSKRSFSDDDDKPPSVKKRKYRKHPKPDANAPKKPSPSAYHLFALKQGEVLRKKGYVFEDIARETGSMWRALSPVAINDLETKTTSAKNQYRKDLSSYKKSAEYTAYQEYLKRWMAKEEAKKKQTNGHSIDKPTPPPGITSSATVSPSSPQSSTSWSIAEDNSAYDWSSTHSRTSAQSSAAENGASLPLPEDWFYMPELSTSEQMQWKWAADFGVTLAPDPLLPGMHQPKAPDMYDPFGAMMPMSSTISPSLITASSSYAF